MKPQLLVKFVFACLLTSCIFLPSCKKESPYVYPHNTNPGAVPTLINVNITAAASSAAYDKVNVDIQGIEYNLSNEAGTVEGWETANIDQAGTIDLMSLLNGRTMRLNTDLLPGDIKQLRIRLGDNNSIEVSGVPRVLNVAPELKETGFVIYTELLENPIYLNALTLNFDATQSIGFDATTDEYSLLPVISCFDETKTGSIEGFISPADAKATIHLEADPNSRTVLNNADAIADASNQGYFKFIGIPEGSYTIEMTAGDGTNRKKILTSVQVSLGATSNVGSNILE